MTLGIKIMRKNDGIMLSQENYVDRLLQKFENFDVTLVSTPYYDSTQLRKNLSDQLAPSRYAQIIESDAFYKFYKT